MYAVMRCHNPDDFRWAEWDGHPIKHRSKVTAEEAMMRIAKAEAPPDHPHPERWGGLCVRRVGDDGYGIIHD